MGCELKFMTAAIIMAGGRSSRMRATGCPLHKALVPVLGVSMLERNVCALIGRGFRNITVAVAANEPAIEHYVANRGAALADVCGAHLELFREADALGTIGAARYFAESSDPVLVVNVDNLTALDLRALYDAHIASDAAMTVATHTEPFVIPYGAVTVDAGSIVEYREKPVHPIRVSSGTYVVGPRAIAAIRPGRPTTVPDLVATLIGAGERVGSFEHETAWTDVNDAVGVVLAENLIRLHAAEFEQWWPTPDSESTIVVVSSPAGVLVRRISSGAEEPSAPAWTTSADGVAIQDDLEPLVIFDAVDLEQRKVVRHRAYVAPLDSTPTVDANASWVLIDGESSGYQLDDTSRRCVAWERNRARSVVAEERRA